MCDKMAISAHILKIVENDPFSRLQITAKEMFNRHQFFYTNKQYVKINPILDGVRAYPILDGGGKKAAPPG